MDSGSKQLRFVPAIRAGWIGCLMVVTAAVSLFSRAAMAEGEEAFFTAMVAPIGSISSPGQATSGVYLRWGVVEGNFPSDLASFRLERDGTVIHTTPAQGVLSAAEINALYAGAENARRRAEVIAWLNELAEGEDPPGPAVNGANFASVLRTRLLGDRFWALFATRNDFNVARAYRRGFLDVADGNVHTYELFAVSTSDESVRIGLVKLDTAISTALPPAADLDQVFDFGRCDAPERFKEHATVVLNWDHPGPSAGDKYVAALLTAGYDLYRTTTNVAAVDPAVDIRALAAGLPHDAGGRVEIPGLEKLNDQPVVISGSAAQEQLGDGPYKPPYFQYLETGPEVTEAGLAPGDTRAYYLVGRDITGNYGQTSGLLVTIPDREAPPAPWAMRTVIDPAHNGGDGRLALEWDAVDVFNFSQAHQRRTYCNLATAAADQKLLWVKAGEDCASGFQVPVDLSVAGYLVYRFSTSAEAAQFTDSDGDGRADIDERTSPTSTTRPLTDSGMACDAGAFPIPSATLPLGGRNYRVATVAAAAADTRASGRKVLSFVDNSPDSPKNNKGDVYWYRIATVDKANNIGTLSAPVRALFPDRDKPERCGPNTTLTEPVCTYRVRVFEQNPELPYAEDTTDDASQVQTTCFSDSTGFQATLTHDIEPLSPGRRGVAMSEQVCEQLLKSCNGQQAAVTYLDSLGNPLAGASVGRMNLETACRAAARTRLERECGRERRPVRPGDRISEGPLRLDCPTEPDECLTLYYDIGGETFHFKTICPATGPIDLTLADFPNLGAGEQICLSAAIRNTNNEVSTKFRIPCFRLPALAVQTMDPPQPVEIAFHAGTNKIDLRWLPPQQPVTGTIVEWYLKGEDEPGVDTQFTDFFPHPGHGASDRIVDVGALITSEPSGSDWEQEWCFRARSVGHGGRISKWSPARCALRTPPGAKLGEYIPWPKIETPPKLDGDNLLGRYLGFDGLPLVLLSDVSIDLDRRCEVHRSLGTCTETTKGTICEGARELEPEAICPQANFCATLRESIAGKLDFVVYRQSTDDPGDPARYQDYVQVSPLIDQLFCTRNFIQIAQGQVTETLADPFIKLLGFNSPNEPNWHGLRLVFADATAHVGGRYYRYQLVYFGPDGEILGHRQTDWIGAQ